MPLDYLPRVADAELDERLERVGAVLIEGVKGCGKTETARRRAASEVALDADPTARQTAQIDPGRVLGGPAPRLVDEWQLVPELWNAVRRAVDARRADGQFILTGSATPADDQTRHSGAGRFSRLRLRPLSLAESGISSDEVSLARLLAGAGSVAGTAAAGLDDLIAETCHGGWPRDRGRPVAPARRNVADLAAEISLGDIKTVDVVRRDPARVRSLLESLARNTATEATVTTLAADAGRAGAPMSPETAAAYLDALERLMVYEPLPTWSPVLRDKARVRRQPVHHLVDPALAAALLGAGPDELGRDLKTFGLLFESLATRDLRVYAGPLQARVGHYRDNTGLEVDLVIDAGHRRWAAFEVKLSGSGPVTDAAAKNLLRLAAKVDVQSAGPPSCLGIITAQGQAYTRSDGVQVVPLATLGP
ncbi:MAG: DUF4143 domain-containing protein [Propionibacteriaceae bacterium]|jgi:predicted AAA+ superfamily ATPase|nr:DUF4143 domain-containing protein [Propionibacteriaceae bacterium]